MSLRLETRALGSAALTVYGVDGRVVRHLTGSAQAGGAAFRWDGRDAHGRAVAAGNYVAAVTTPAGRVARTIQIVR
jgi:flagellar hook assembly protein FlgD